MKRLWNFALSKPVAKVFAILFALLGIYGTFVYEKKTSLQFDVVSNANVLDVKERLNNLEIIYAGTNLKEKNQTLYLLTIRVTNVGSTDILKSNYDEVDPLGFIINSGKILETPSIAGDLYLVSNLKPLIKNDRTVTFSPVILNSGDVFEIKTLLLANQGEQPTVTPIGKIAGVHKIELIESFNKGQDRNILNESFSGDGLVQIIRIVSYFILCIFLIAFVIGFVAVPYSFISKQWTQRKRIKLVEKYKALANRHISLKEDYFLTQYTKMNQEYDLLKAIALSKTDEILNEIMMNTPGVARRATLDSAWGEQIKKLEISGLIVRDGPQIFISEDIATQLAEFITFTSAS